MKRLSCWSHPKRRNSDFVVAPLPNLSFVIICNSLTRTSALVSLMMPAEASAPLRRLRPHILTSAADILTRPGWTARPCAICSAQVAGARNGRRAVHTGNASAGDDKAKRRGKVIFSGIQPTGVPHVSRAVCKRAASSYDRTDAENGARSSATTWAPCRTGSTCSGPQRQKIRCSSAASDFMRSRCRKILPACAESGET